MGLHLINQSHKFWLQLFIRCKVVFCFLRKYDLPHDMAGHHWLRLQLLMKHRDTPSGLTDKWFLTARVRSPRANGRGVAGLNCFKWPFALQALLVWWLIFIRPRLALILNTRPVRLVSWQTDLDLVIITFILGNDIRYTLIALHIWRKSIQCWWSLQTAICSEIILSMCDVLSVHSGWLQRMILILSWAKYRVRVTGLQRLEGRLHANWVIAF